MRKRINKILWHGDELFEEKAKAPGIATSADGLDGLNEGEIYISNNEKDPALFIRTSSGKVVRVGVNYEELKKLFLSKTDDDTAEGVITFNKGMKLPAGEQTVWYKDFDISSLEIITKGVGIFADSTDAEQFGEMVSTDADMASTDFIDLQKANYIDISLLAAKDEASRMGLVFYNAENVPVKGYYISGQEEDGYVSRKIAVPEGATQIRFSAWSITDETLYLKLGYFADTVNTSLISSLIKADEVETAEFSENSLLTAAAFGKLFTLKKDDKGNFYIHTPYSFASDKTVSSLGVGKEGEGEVSAISALYKLVDVLRDGENDRVSGAEDGNVLMFDAATGKWYGKKVDIPKVDFTEVSREIDGLQRQLNTLISGDASDAIDTFNEVVAFLKDIEDTDTLKGILSGKQNKIDANNKLDYSLLANTPSLADFMGGSAIGGTASSDNFSAVYWDGTQWQTRTIYKWSLASVKPSYTTSEVTEGNNLYFTDSRAKDALKKTTDDLSARIAKFEKMFQWGNGEDSYVKTPFPLASDSTVSSLGIGSDGNGGVSYDRLDSWDNYDAGAGAVLSATLGYELKQAIENIDLGDFDLTDYLTKEEAGKTYATIASLSGYQPLITDLATIRANAVLGATALQSSALNGYATEYFVTSQGYFLEKNFTKANVKSTLGVSDWALASEKPSYTTSEVTEGSNLYFTNQRAITALEGITRDLSDRIAAYEKVLKIEDGGKLLHALVSFASDSTVSSLGIGSDGNGGVSYDRLDSWDNYVEGDGSVLSSYLGHGLLQRIEQLEDGTSGDFSDIEEKVDKNTNAITNLSISLNDFLTGVDVDDTINRWKELEKFLEDYTETATLAELLKGKQNEITSDNKLDASLVNGLATVATSGKYSDLSGTPTKLSDFTDDVVNGHYQPLISTTNRLAYSLLDGAPTALKNPYSLKFGNKSYDGSEEKTITADDLGALTKHQAIYALTVKDSAGTTKLTYTPNDKAGEITLTKEMVGLGDVENTKLSTWAGTSNITTIGTITTGTWNATKIANDYIANPHVTIAGNKVDLGGTLSVDTLQTSLDIVTRSTDQEITGKKTFTKRTIFKDGIQIGNSEAYIYWDADKNVLRTNVSFASDKTVSSLGVGSESGGGGSADWGAVPTSIVPTVNGEYNLGDNSKMWKTLYVQQGFIGSVISTSSYVTISSAVSGNGNTWQIGSNGAASFSSLTVGGSAINFGNFATYSQLSSYVTLNTQQTIVGAKNFQNGLNFYGELKGHDTESGGDNIVLNANNGSGSFLSLTIGGKAVATQEFVTSQGYTTNVGTVTAVKINGSTKNPTNGIVDLGTISVGDTAGLQSQIDELGRNLSNLTTSYNDLNSTVEDIDKNKLFAKVDKVTGKGLSTNDFTAAYKTSLDNLTSATGLASGYIKKLKADTFDLGGSVVATTDDLDDFGNTIDNLFARKTSLATVATSGSYNDLTNKPTIPSAITVTNNLTSTSTSAALSANQGRVLNNKFADYLSLSGTASSATKLATARTIWGQSFDGSGNVSGNIHLDNNIIYGSGYKNALDLTGGGFNIGYGYRNDTAISYWGNAHYFVTGGNIASIINSSGNISIGSSDLAGSTYKLYVNGNTYINGSLNYTSDEKLKSIVGDVRLPLTSMAYAPLVQFAWNNGIDSRLHVGTIAQYWESVLPEVVSTTPNDTLALAYGELGVAMGISLANHLTETNDEVSKLKKRVEELESENKRLQERVDALVA